MPIAQPLTNCVRVLRAGQPTAVLRENGDELDFGLTIRDCLEDGDTVVVRHSLERASLHRRVVWRVLAGQSLDRASTNSACVLSSPLACHSCRSALALVVPMPDALIEEDGVDLMHVSFTFRAL